VDRFAERAQAADQSGTSEGADLSRRTLPSWSMMQIATDRSDTSNAA